MRDGKIDVASRLAGVAALFFCHFIFANQAHAAPVDIAATRTNVLNYITNLKNQPNNKVLSGQHAGDSLPTANPFSAQSGYASYITALKTSSGKLVAIAGAGYDALSPTIRPLSDLLNVNTVLKAHWNSGGLVEIGFATHNPWTGGQCGDINTTGHTLTDVATPGTPANINFVRQLDDFATALADFLFQYRTTRTLTVWYMNGKTLSTSATLTIIPSATEIVVGVGDFNGDGKDDILWRYLGTGHTYVWTMNGRTVTASGFTTVYPGTNAAWSSQVMRSALDPQ